MRCQAPALGPAQGHCLLDKGWGRVESWETETGWISSGLERGWRGLAKTGLGLATGSEVRDLVGPGRQVLHRCLQWQHLRLCRCCCRWSRPSL